jgi:nitrite reductase/ring-hydroxylating ferredoxin subunit
MVVKGTDRPIALFFSEGQVRAVDNRCPHMGFPLHKGTVQDGILICHWHHARFDLASGCTFDLFADDVPAYPVEVEGDDVYLLAPQATDQTVRGLRRLRTGMEQNVSLVLCKSIIGLLKEGVSLRDIVREAALFGARNRDGMGSGMVILGAMANVASLLEPDDAALALSQGIVAAARDTAGMAPRRDRYPLDRTDLDLDTSRRWFRHWALARHRDGAERTLATSLQEGASPAEATGIIFSAITDRFYADGGHTLDFANKAFELAELVGWEHASDLLPALTPGIVGARGAEESSPWHTPVDLISLMTESFERLPDLMAQGEGKPWSNEVGLADSILGDDPTDIIDALCSALAQGATPQQLGRSLALAAITRIARFGTANEFFDWDTALHTFTYSNAICQVLKRCPSLDVVRGVFHGAMSVYQDRFLNVPPAAVPLDDASLGDLPHDPHVLLEGITDTLNMQQRVGETARLVSRYAGLGHAEGPLLQTLALTTIREDAAFHTFQMLEAGIRQYQEWRGTPQARLILIAMARYAAAHAPTQRSFLQTFAIAQRLHRGDMLYEE